MIPLESIIAFAIASTLLGLAPGPDNISVIAQSGLYGRKAGIFVTLGLCTGLAVHTTAVALGIAVVFQTSMIAFWASTQPSVFDLFVIKSFTISFASLISLRDCCNASEDSNVLLASLAA